MIRKAESVGSQIAVVCDEFEIVELCKQANVSVFSSIPEAQKYAWRRPKKTRRLMGRSLLTTEQGRTKELKKIKQDELRKLPDEIRVIIFIIALIAVFAMIALFVPSAEINLEPKTVPQQVKITIWSNPNVQSINLSGAVPMKKIPIVLEGSLIKKSTGVERIPTQFASGMVDFRNLTTRRIEIPAGTVVRTIGDDPERFKTTKPITLEAGIDTISSVTVTAINAGVDGNVNADQIQAVEGEIGGNVVVINPTALSGGVDTKVTAPSVEDVQNAKNELLDLLIKDVKSEFLKQGKSDVFFLIEELITLDEVLIEKINPEIGIPSDQFQLTMEVRFMVSYLSSNDIKSIASQTLSTNLESGYRMLPETLIVQPIGDPEINLAAEEIRLNVIADDQAMLTVSKNDILVLVTGKNITMAYSNLAEIFDSVEINIQPGFLKKMPLLAFRIKVNINENGL